MGNDLVIKNKMLQTSFGSSVDPMSVLTDIFGSNKVVLLSKGKQLKVRYFNGTIATLFSNHSKYFEFSDSYLSYCRFRAMPLKGENCSFIYALVVDIDHVASTDLEEMLKLPFIMPKYIVSSGNGLHFIYPISYDCASQDRLNEIKAILKHLCMYIKTSLIDLLKKKSDAICVDFLPITQVFRLPGSLTKSGERCQIFKNKKPYDFNIVSFLVAYPMPPAVQQTQSTQMPDKKIIRTGHIKSAYYTYEYAFKKIKAEEPMIGNRYNQMLGLTILAIKANIDRKDQYQKLEDLMNCVFNRETNDHITTTQIEEVLALYEKEYSIKITSNRLEEYLGFTFERKTKRNGCSRTEHLKKLGDIKKEEYDTRKNQFRLLLDQKLSKEMIMETMNISKATYFRFKKNLNSDTTSVANPISLTSLSNIGNCNYVFELHRTVDVNADMKVNTKSNKTTTKVTNLSSKKKTPRIMKNKVTTLPVSKEYTVQKNGHVHIKSLNSYYSVPYTYIGKLVKVNIKNDQIEIIYEDQTIAMHTRKKLSHGSDYVTDAEHMASTHKIATKWDVEYFENWAERISPEVKITIHSMIKRKKFPEQAYKACFAVLLLEKKYSAEALIHGCIESNRENKPYYPVILEKIKNFRNNSVLPFSTPLEDKEYNF